MVKESKYDNKINISCVSHFVFQYGCHFTLKFVIFLKYHREKIISNRFYVCYTVYKAKTFNYSYIIYLFHMALYYDIWEYLSLVCSTAVEIYIAKDITI